MSPKFSEAETQQLRRSLHDAEKNLRWWPWLRWLQLILAIIAIALSLYSYWRMQDVSEQFSFVQLGVESNRATEAIETAVNIRAEELEREIHHYFKAVLFGIIGLLVLTSTLLNWRSSRINFILATGLRFMLDSQAESEASPNKSFKKQPSAAGTPDGAP